MNRLPIHSLFEIVVILKDNLRVREGQLFGLFRNHNEKRLKLGGIKRPPLQVQKVAVERKFLNKMLPEGAGAC